MVTMAEFIKTETEQPIHIDVEKIRVVETNLAGGGSYLIFDEKHKIAVIENPLEVESKIQKAKGGEK